MFKTIRIVESPVISKFEITRNIPDTAPTHGKTWGLQLTEMRVVSCCLFTRRSLVRLAVVLHVRIAGSCVSDAHLISDMLSVRRYKGAKFCVRALSKCL